VIATQASSIYKLPPAELDGFGQAVVKQAVFPGTPDTDQPAGEPIAVDADDAAAVPHLVSRDCCERADVYRDGSYLFTMKREVGDFRIVYQRDD
jgi:hypothetical protein